MNITHNPVSTYRVQLHKDFNFAELRKILPYLRNLGIKTIYASPVFEAMPGSTHGYDGTDPNTINPEIGTEDELRAISLLCKQDGIQWLQDIVPNHLSFHEKNKWLIDVLAKGRFSVYASFFDIIWDHPVYGDKVMVPFPGSPLEHYLKKHIPGEDHYTITDWRETEKVINYRRFFTVNSLICTNLHHEHVFVKYHELVAKLLRDKTFDGLRVDHIDGLHDPKEYLQRLRLLAGEKTYLVVEKILEPGEDLKTDWDIQGTSGYEFLGAVNNLLTNTDAEEIFSRLYHDITGDDTPVPEQVKQKKALILFDYMGGELDNLVRLYRSLGGGKNKPVEQTRKDIAKYLIDCPVYRYYGSDIPTMPDDSGTTDESILSFYRRAMQFTGPLMAKGVEDTLMYTFNRFIGHNEVGDSPNGFGMKADAFHKIMQHRQQHWSLSLNATSTHDTKRGEDSRARLNALTNFPEEWAAVVQTWTRDNKSLVKNNMPDANDEYFVYQTLVASYPYLFHVSNSHDRENELGSYRQRITEYLQKALREAKRHTTYTDPNDEYEKNTIGFAQALISGDNGFHTTFLPFLQKISDMGMINSLTQLTLKFTCPGVPDTYQGTELWDLSLVDPDNRRAVDYSVRMEMLKKDLPFYTLWPDRGTGHIKLSLLRKLLQIRNDYTALFAKGEYIPVHIEGALRSHLLAFMRRSKEDCMLVVVPLHPGLLTADLPVIDWKDTRLVPPQGLLPGWTNLVTSNKVTDLSIASLLEDAPVGIFIHQ